MADLLNLRVGFASFVTGREFDQGGVDGVGIGIRRVGGLRSVGMEVWVVWVVDDVVGAGDDVVVVVVIVDDGAVVKRKIIVIDVVVDAVDIGIF